MISPDSADLVEKRLERVRVLPDVEEREVRDDVAASKHQDGKEDQPAQEERREIGCCHEAPIAARGAHEGYRSLKEGRPRTQEPAQIARFRHSSSWGLQGGFNDAA